MNKSTPTPRTDVVSRMPYADGQDWIDLAHELERELTAVTEQRDRLAEALRKFVGDALFCSHADIATDVLPPEQVGDTGDAQTMP
jgi:hypothetical protein